MTPNADPRAVAAPVHRMLTGGESVASGADRTSGSRNPADRRDITCRCEPSDAAR